MKQDKYFRFLVNFWFIPIVLFSFSCALVYIVAQQTIREQANHPQIELATEIANYLEENPTRVPTALGFVRSQLVNRQINLAKSQMTFGIIYNEKKQAIESTAKLNGKVPELPAGVLENVEKTGINKFTWEPQKDVRIASVIVKVNGNKVGYVLVGKSLSETEKLEHKVLLYSLSVWIGGLAISLILILLGQRFGIVTV